MPTMLDTYLLYGPRLVAGGLDRYILARGNFGGRDAMGRQCAWVGKTISISRRASNAVGRKVRRRKDGMKLGTR